MDYYIYLKNTNEYIKETDDDKIWTRTKNINYAFNDSDYDRVNNIAMFICEEKHLCMKDMLIMGEKIIIETTEYPVGRLNELYFIDNYISNDLTKLHKTVEKYSFLYELDELTFDDLYYTIDTVQMLIDWCDDNGYKWYELERHFKGLKLFKEETK